MSTSNMKNKVFIIGDSMIKKLDRYLLTNSIKHKYPVKVRPFFAAKAVDMFDYQNQFKETLTQTHTFYTSVQTI